MSHPVATNRVEEIEKRKGYRPPLLVEYGDVRKLTQTGGSGSSDFGGPTAMALQHGH